MTSISSVCVYCGSSTGHNQTWARSAAAFGRILAENDIRLVYGGGSIGLMGVLSEAVMAAGGTVVGIIPDFLDRREKANLNVSELVRVDNMHERKRAMFERSDAFVALPGGLGTLDELFEIVTWRQLELHDKPVVLANIEGYWTPLQTLIDTIIDHGFARPAHRSHFILVDTVDAILPALRGAALAAVEAQPDRL
jgi:uncharacterized protein (TIGR00730 family)